jgi:hypothetical protein
MFEDAAARRQQRREERARVRAQRRAITEKRAAICRECPDAVAVAGRKVFCGRCACPLVSKTRDPAAACPLGKWSPSTGAAT